jgi:CheY-like chemotaxis protein
MARVLVVDDHEDTVAITVELLRSMGHEAKGCYSGREALALVGEFNPDCVLMDIGMPNGSGWETAQEIRLRFPGKRPMLIAITGEYKGPADLMLSKMNGFDHYVLKPAHIDALAPLIERAESQGR